MRILATGGAGYIGSVAVAELLKAGHEVLVYDSLAHGYATAVPAGAHLITGEIADGASLDRALAGVEAVMHFAALIEAGESMRTPEKYFRNNTMGTLTLLEAMTARGIRRLVFSSTAAVYGEPETTPIPETHPLRPVNAYGESKLLAERMLAWFARVHGLRYTSLRYFNAAGASGDQGEAHQPESHLIPLALEVALGKRDALPIYGADYPTPDGTCVRDYIHVLDLVAAHLLALDALDRREQAVYNLGNGRGFSVREVVETVRRVTGHSIPVRESPRRAGDPAVLVAASEKIRQELGWQPRFADLEAIVSSAWEWRRRHPEGYAANAIAAEPKVSGAR